MEAVAKLRNCRMSERKMRRVVNNIRGKKVGEALNIVRFTKSGASAHVEKTLLSAIANWENKNGMVANAEDYDLFVKTAFVDQAGMMKRILPAPQGRAHRIRKRLNHLTIVVENRVPLEETTVEEIAE